MSVIGLVPGTAAVRRHDISSLYTSVKHTAVRSIEITLKKRLSHFCDSTAI